MKHLVLLGGGHAQVHVLRDLATRPIPDVAVTLVDPEPSAVYTGMVPGHVAGQYPLDALTIDLVALARRAGARVVLGAARTIDAARRTVAVNDGSLPFDVLSLDVGHDVSGRDLPGVDVHALRVRPIARLRDLTSRIDHTLATHADGNVRVAVVGAGVGALEIAFAVDRRIRRTGGRPCITLIDARTGFAPELPAPVRDVVGRLLRKRGVTLCLGQPVTAVEPDGPVLRDGTRWRADLTLWLTGAAPPPLFAHSGLPLSEAGYLSVDATLRASDGSSVFGAGDCVTIAGAGWVPKAGVYAVREGPILSHNLRACLTGAALRRYEPQRDFLRLLNTGDGRALWIKWGRGGHGRWAWWLKDWIDRRFVAKFTVS